jgi:hypothetical protein
MRTVNRKSYLIRTETLESQLAAGRYNPSYELHFRDRHGRHVVTLDAGSDDHVSIFRDGEITFALSRNTRIGYCGLQAFRGDDEIGDVFMQNPSEDLAGEGLTQDWDDYAPINLAKILAQWIDGEQVTC